MMFDSKVPQQLWVEAFFTANFIANLLPSSVLQDKKSLYQVLNGHAPVYTSLRVFGCKCYPYLRPYMKDKFDPKSLVCVFLGYNEKYKGYRCFYPPTGKVFISRHVLFEETHFPFSDIYSKYHRDTDSTLLKAWRSVNLSVPLATEEVVSPEELPANVVVPIVLPQALPPQSPVNHDDIIDDEVHQASGSESDTDHSEVEQQVVPPPAAPAPHSMTTRARAGIIKPNPRYAMVTVKESHSEPRSVKAALQDPRWNASMQFEIDNMEETETYSLVPPEEGQNPIGCGWVYKTKLNADGTVLKLRSRLVARGNQQEEGLDFLETFSPVVRTATIRIVLHVAVIKKWQIKQLDVQNAFLHGDLKETVYMVQPPGFEDKTRHDYVCKLKKAIYGLKQAPRAWFDKFSTFLLEFGFQCSFPDPSLFIYHQGTNVIYLLLYVDDMILTGNNEELLKTLLEKLNTVFRMKDMGPVHYFLGIQVHQLEDGLFLNQAKYAQDLLITAGMQDCSPMPTPLPMKLASLPGQDELFAEPSYFRSLAGKL